MGAVRRGASCDVCQPIPAAARQPRILFSTPVHSGTKQLFSQEKVLCWLWPAVPKREQCRDVLRQAKSGIFLKFLQVFGLKF